MSLFWLVEHDLLVLALQLAEEQPSKEKVPSGSDQIDEGVFAALYVQSLAGGHPTLLSLATAQPRPPVSIGYEESSRLWMVGQLPIEIAALPEFLVELRIRGRISQRFIVKTAGVEKDAVHAVVAKAPDWASACLETKTDVASKDLVDPTILGHAAFVDHGASHNMTVWPYKPAVQNPGTGRVRLSLQGQRGDAQYVVLEDERVDGELDLSDIIGCALLPRSECGDGGVSVAETDSPLLKDAAALLPISAMQDSTGGFLGLKRPSAKRLEILHSLVPRDLMLFAALPPITLISAAQESDEADVVDTRHGTEAVEREVDASEHTPDHNPPDVLLFEASFCGLSQARVGQALQGDTALDQSLRDAVHRWASGPEFAARCGALEAAAPTRTLDASDLKAIWIDPSLLQLKTAFADHDLAPLAPVLSAVENLWHASFEPLQLDAVSGTTILPLLASRDIGPELVADMEGSFPQEGGLYDRFLTWLWGSKAQEMARPNVRTQAALVASLARHQSARAFVIDFAPDPMMMAELFQGAAQLDTTLSDLRELSRFFPSATQPSAFHSQATREPFVEQTFADLEVEAAYPKLAAFFGASTNAPGDLSLIGDIEHFNALVGLVEQGSAGKTAGLSEADIQSCLAERELEVAEEQGDLAWRPLSLEKLAPQVSVARAALFERAERRVAALTLLSKPPEAPVSEPIQKAHA